MRRKISALAIVFGFLTSGSARSEFDGKLGLKVLGNFYPEVSSYYWAGFGAGVYAIWNSGFALDFEYNLNQVQAIDTSLTSPANLIYTASELSSFTVAPGIALTKSEFLLKGSLKLGAMGSKFAGGIGLSGDWVAPTGFTVGIHSSFLSQLKSSPASFYNVGIGLGLLF